MASALRTQGSNLRAVGCIMIVSTLAVVLLLQKHESTYLRLEPSESDQRTTKLAFLVSGQINNFDPSQLPGGMLQGIHVHPVAGCGNFVTGCNTGANGIIIAGDGRQDDPVDDIMWAQSVNNHAQEQLTNGALELKELKQSLKNSAKLEKQVDAKISKVKAANKILDEKINKIVGASALLKDSAKKQSEKPQEAGSKKSKKPHETEGTKTEKTEKKSKKHSEWQTLTLESPAN